MEFIGTAWALLPPLVAIGLALITKEVYSSLFLGIVAAALLYSNLNIIMATTEMFNVMIEKVGSEWNIGIIFFLVFLGTIVALMTKAGGSKAYGDWAQSKIRSKRGATLSTMILGIIIFVDDYFNCLTVGSVMRPVTDKFKISRAKLAYIIDSTAAPVCIIAPISSWAAAVTGYTTGDGFSLFLNTIPFNLYAWLTIIMVFIVCYFGFDFGEMKKHEECAEHGDLFYGENDYEIIEDEKVSSKGKVLDLILPVLFLIFSCVTCMIYTGGFFEGVPFITAFQNCNASFGLMLGSFFTLVFVFFLYIPRKVINFKEFFDAIPVGFKMMVPVIIILVLAWTLGGFVSDKLQAGIFVESALSQSNVSTAFLPPVLFVIAIGLAFATGTSWGTFGILIPIITAIFPEGDTMLVICIASILAGAVCGDHISPISDTTIMASAGAQSNHVYHVTTQIPYVLVVASACLVGYIVAGLTQSALLSFGTALTILFIILFVIKKYNK